MAIISGQGEGLSMRRGRWRRPEYQGRPQTRRSRKEGGGESRDHDQGNSLAAGRGRLPLDRRGADEYAATAFNINILKQGNIHTHTMRAFTEMTKILAHVD